MKPPVYLVTLTPLRGIAALLVVLYHASIFIGPLTAPGLTGLIDHGWLWVDFFFVLSGFVLLHVYRSHFQENLSWASYRKYLFARFARIYPLHLSTLIVSVLLILVIRGLASGLMPIMQALCDLNSIPAALLLLQSLHLFDTPPLNAPSWSLSAEWWVYVLFPLLVRPLFRLNRRGEIAALLAIAAFYLFLMYYLAPRHGNLIFAEMGMARGATLDVTADWGYFRCLAGFSLGMVTYRFYLHGRAFPLLRSGWAFIALASAVLGGMHGGMHELAIISFFPLLILAAAYNADFVHSFLSGRVLQRLGDWSFSIYMVHMLLVFGYWITLLAENPGAFAQFPQGAPDYAQNWLLTLALLAATVLVSGLTYQYVEVPARQNLGALLSPKPILSQPVAAS